MENEVEFIFCVDGREVVRLTPDGEIVFATEVTLSDLRSAVVYLVSKVRASSPSPLTAEQAKERAQKIITDWHDYEKRHDPSMMPIPPFSGAQEEELTRLKEAITAIVESELTARKE
jgi:hypothetical protein